MSKQAKKGTAKGPVQKAVFDARKDAERERQRLVGETGTDPLKDEYLKRHLTCKICGYEWVSRKTFPKQCPGCKSQRWNRGTPDPQAVLMLRLEGIKRIHAASPKYISTYFDKIEKAITAKIKELDEQEMADYEAIRKESE